MNKFILIFTFFICSLISKGQIITIDTIQDISLYNKQIEKSLLLISYLKIYENKISEIKKLLNFRNENENNFLKKLQSAKTVLDIHKGLLTKKNIIITKEKILIGKNIKINIIINVCVSDNSKFSEKEYIQFRFEKNSDEIYDMIVNKRIDVQNLLKEFPEAK